MEREYNTYKATAERGRESELRYDQRKLVWLEGACFGAFRVLGAGGRFEPPPLIF